MKVMADPGTPGRRWRAVWDVPTQCRGILCIVVCSASRIRATEDMTPGLSRWGCFRREVFSGDDTFVSEHRPDLEFRCVFNHGRLSAAAHGFLVAPPPGPT